MNYKSTVAEIQLVVFALEQEFYAVDINMVREIIQLLPVTRVPGTPPSVEGVINLRGSVIPIVDLRKKFQLKILEQRKDTRIVVINCKGQDVGVIVDSVAHVLRIPVDAIESASSVFTDEQVEHLLGIVKLSDKVVILLDMDQVLSRQDIVALNTIDIKSIKAEKNQTVTAGKGTK
jgi:purine-binding chemotaxis protein CheW